MMSRGKLKGFTLIELMITVVIIAILAAIALPSYDSYIKKSRRSDAMATLLKIQLEQEKYRVNNPAYTTAALLGFTASIDSYYTIATVSNSATAFLITAAPAGAQTGDTCGTFAIDQNGTNSTGTYATDKCWQK